MVKRLYQAISLTAVLNLAALAGLTAYAWKQGWLERERVRGAVDILKGQVPEATEAVERVSNEPATADQARERIRRNEEEEEKYRIQLAQRETEIKRNFELLELERLNLVREKEAVEEEERTYLAQRERLAREQGDSGLQKELEVLSGIRPKGAKELLKLKDDADVVRIMLAMDPRKVSKIVKQCKTNEERRWIGRIMEKFGDDDAAQAEDLGAGAQR